MIRRNRLNLAVLEALERRRLLAAELAGGVLTVTGTDADDVIVLTHDGADFTVAAGVGLLPDESVGSRVPNRPDTMPGPIIWAGIPI